jgi:hypothetical protein
VLIFFVNRIAQGFNQIVKVWLLLVRLPVHRRAFLLAPALRHRQKERDFCAAFGKRCAKFSQTVAVFKISNDSRAFSPFVASGHSYFRLWRDLVNFSFHFFTL